MSGLRITKADVEWVVARGLLRKDQAALLAAGIWWRKSEPRLSAARRARLPAGRREMLQARHPSLGSD
jgi:hypothetical protein